jgi:hypothetical protein
MELGKWIESNGLYSYPICFSCQVGGEKIRNKKVLTDKHFMQTYSIPGNHLLAHFQDHSEDDIR